MNSSIPFRAKKSLGQNFLINPTIVRKIIESCQLKATDLILEIGPGTGILTNELSKYVKKVFAIEKDKALANILKQNYENTNVSIINADFLKHSLSKLPNNMKVVGNLPYNIATPIITKIIENRHKFSDVFLTVQLEYGQRIVAKHNTANYGAFSCFVQFYAEAKKLFKIKNSSFRPIPKVQSCFLHLKFFKKPEYNVNSEEHLFKVVHACFGQRRKTIQNSLSTMLDKKKVSALLEELHINPKMRAENISLKDFVRMSNEARNK